MERTRGLRIETQASRLQLASTPEEIDRVLRLRHEVFCEEYALPARSSGRDEDEFDAHALHLLLEDRSTGEAIGTYRLIPSNRVERHYSENEFEFRELLESTPGTKLELGRACIRKEARNGATLSLLWRGILQVSQTLEATALFGCSSLNTQSPMEIAQALSALHQLKAWEPTAHVRVRTPYLPETYGIRLPDPLTLTPGKIPPLILSYVRAGAKILGPPAFDAEFQCFDVLTWLEPQTLAARNRRRWGSA